LACEGTECQTEGKAFDLKKFMREQAASTRTPEAMRETRGKARRSSAHRAPTHKVARAHKSRHRTVAARPRREEQPHEAASAHAEQQTAPAEQQKAPDNPEVHVVSADELNDIDRAAGPPPAVASSPAETDGQASATMQDGSSAAQDVQVVVGNDFNEIDRKAADMVQRAAAVTAGEVTPHSRVAAMSWMQWLWSAIGAGFVVLAGIARYLFA
jgi:hypothetical protein